MNFQEKTKSGYSRSEVGVIPEDWECVKLGDIAGTITTGKLDANAMRVDGEYPFFTCAREVYRIDHFAFDADALLVSGNGANVGYVHHYVGRFNAYQRTYVLKDFKTESLYLKLQLERGIQDRIRTEINAGNTPYILKGTLSGMNIPVPRTIEEQRAIANALRDADALIASLDALIAKKRDLKQAAMQQLLTGKTRLPGFKGKWEVKKLGEIATIRNEKISTLGADVAVFCVELEQVGQNTGQIESHSDARGRRSVKYHFRKCDVLFGRLRPYLRKFWWANCDGVCSTEIWPMVPIGDRLVPGFLYQIVRTDEFIEAANSSYGTHMPRSDWKALREFEFSLPSDPDEQTAIAAALSDMDDELTALEAKRDKTRAIKHGMMQELLTGRIRLV